MTVLSQPNQYNNRPDSTLYLKKINESTLNSNIKESLIQNHLRKVNSRYTFFNHQPLVISPEKKPVPLNQKAPQIDQTPEKFSTLIKRCKKLVETRSQIAQDLNKLDENTREKSDKAELEYTLFSLKNTEFPPTRFYIYPELNDAEKQEIIINFQKPKIILPVKGSRIPLKIHHRPSSQADINTSKERKNPPLSEIKIKNINGRKVELMELEGKIKLASKANIKIANTPTILKENSKSQTPFIKQKMSIERLQKHRSKQISQPSPLPNEKPHPFVAEIQNMMEDNQKQINILMKDIGNQQQKANEIKARILSRKK